MTDKQFYTVFGAALTAADRDEYVSEWALSSLFGYGEIDPKLVCQLEDIWDIAHTSIREIRAKTGMTQMQFAEHFLIPKRTVENWEGDVSKCADYLRLLLAESVGMYRRPVE